jgi:8-oxo-dGTP pyrophosphatase MutT (NUDIX family)
MSLHNHALWQVATKALLFDGDKVLVLITPDGYLDFPGGRVDESERDIPWTETLRREISEEISADIQVDIGQTLFVSKREYHSGGQEHHIAAIFFRCDYRGGDVTLSDEHGGHEWMTIAELLARPEKFVSADEKSQLQTLFA